LSLCIGLGCGAMFVVWVVFGILTRMKDPSISLIAEPLLIGFWLGCIGFVVCLIGWIITKFRRR
jgi:hypothetical protein